MSMKQRRREDGEPEKIFSSSFQGKLHHLDVGAGGELSLLGKHGPKSAGGLCRQFEVLVHTLDQLYKVNRCLARYSPRATTTNRPTTGH